MPLFLYSSNRMENLVSALAESVRQPLISPFSPEILVTQSKGMQRWLAMELAGRFGVWANCSYPFPNAIIWQLFSRVFSSLPDSSCLSPEVLVWKIVGLMPELLPTEPFAPLRHYLADDRDGLKCYQLAVRIADCFDQYTLFRPDILRGWESGQIPKQQDECWQCILWNRLLVDCGCEHRGALLERYCSSIYSGDVAPSALPERISLFGISYLPPYHLKILDATAALTEVNLYLLSPTREYWGDIVGRREQARRPVSLNAEPYEGNPLLASLGKLGRDFSDMMLDLNNVVSVDTDVYHDPCRDTLLHTLQSDILTLGGGEPEIKYNIAPHDTSLVIASCHSPLREVEVLYDTLLDLLSKDADLNPREIVVMMPDIEQYAPYIITVFGGVLEQGLRIPYSIADRTPGNQGTVAAILQKLIQLPGSRLTSVQLFDLLSAEPVKQRYGLDEQELGTIRFWLEETRICWGLDGNNRTDFGLAGYRENTWRAGLERLLLGYAMPDESGTLYGAILPYDNMEGSSVVTLAKLLDFIDDVESVVQTLATSRTLSGWCDELRNLLDRVVANNESTCDELLFLNVVFAELSELEHNSGYTELCPLPVLRSWLTTRLQKSDPGIGFLSGGVTFCAMLPMRSIPFKVVALLGLSDGAFPRQSRAPGFDLLAKAPRRGDRSLRDEDRYLFLEALLSARQSLYISYVGQSIRDGSDVPPSVLVSELLDAIDRVFRSDGYASAQERLVTKHRLQPFCREYFSPGSPLFSYSSENMQAVADSGSTVNQRSFLTRPLPEPADEMRNVQLSQLIRFFNNPSVYFLQSRLGVRLQKLDVPLNEREPFSLEGVEGYSIKQEILEGILAGKSLEHIFEHARARGLLPPAGHGLFLFEKISREVHGFAETVTSMQAGQIQLKALDVELDCSSFHVSGRLNHVWSDGMFRFRHATLKGKDLVSAWIEHVVLNAQPVDGYPSETVLILKNSVCKFIPPENTEEILSSILNLYWYGLTTPLPYFPKAAYAYSYKQAWDIAKARKEWVNSHNDMPAEADEPAFKLCFGDCDPIDDEFARIVRAIYSPLMEHLQEVAL